MKKVKIFYWVGRFPKLVELGLEHNSIHEMPEDEIGVLVKNIADFGFYVMLKQYTQDNREQDYTIFIDDRRFTQR